MRAFAVERIFNRYETGTRRLAPCCFEVVAHMGEEYSVDTVEYAVAHHERLARN